MKEDISSYQPFSAYPHYSIRSKKDAIDELLQACGRFRSPLTVRERIRLLLSRMFGQSDLLANVTDVVAPGTPLNWQSILRYLYAKKIIAEPHFSFVSRSNDLPKMYGVELKAVQDPTVSDGREMKTYGYAGSFSPEIAMSKAIGEVLERYLLTLYRRDTLHRASTKDLARRGVRVLDIQSLNSFLPWQIEKNGRFNRDEDAPLYWIKGQLIDGTAAQIPAQLVFWNYDPMHDRQEPLLAHATTSGAAGHFTKTEAVLSGLIELIERDGFLIYWLNKLSPRMIDTASIESEEFARLSESVKRYGLSMHFLDTTSDVGIPCVTCALIDDRAEDPIVVISAAGGFAVEDTILKSAYEALDVLQFRMRNKDHSLPKLYKPFTDFQIGQRERIAMWKGKEMMEHFSFFLKGEKESVHTFLRNTPHDLSAKERLQYVLERLRSLGAGYEVFLYEARHAVLSVLGYHVVRTIVPQLLPLYLNENFATLNSKRLVEVPRKLGFEPADMLNPWPHPFP